jgi:hypothetical protein
MSGAQEASRQPSKQAMEAAKELVYSVRGWQQNSPAFMVKKSTQWAEILDRHFPSCDPQPSAPIQPILCECGRTLGHANEPDCYVDAAELSFLVKGLADATSEQGTPIKETNEHTDGRTSTSVGWIRGSTADDAVHAADRFLESLPARETFPEKSSA